MINTIIFDIGNVLVGFDWGGYIDRLFEGETAEIVKHAIFGSGAWNEIDRGVKSRDEMLELFADNAPEGYDEEIRIAFDNIKGAFERLSYTDKWIKELKKRGYRVLYLSNYSYHAMQCCPSILDFTDLMDGGIFSCNVKMMKPDRGIYERLISDYSLVPQECVFIDDNADNIEAAKKMNINTIHFTYYEQAYNELNSMLCR